MLDILNTKKAAAISLANGASVSQETAPGTIVAVQLSRILDNPYQYRGHYDAEHILKLASSIKSLKSELVTTKGLQQLPLARVVMEKGGELEIIPRHYYTERRVQETLTNPRAAAQLMFGHSRLRAFYVLEAGLKTLLRLRDNGIGLTLTAVPEIETAYAELWDGDPDYAEMPVMLGFALDHAMWGHAVTENSQRKNVGPIDEARSLQRAMDEFGLTTEEAGKPFGYARSTAANKIRLLSLPADVQKQIAGGELTERHGRALLKLAEDPERVRKAAETAVKKGQNVRQLEESVEWEERALKEAKEKARQLAAARTALASGWQTPHGETLTADRVKDTADWQAVSFDKTDPKDRILVEQGGCNSQCECLALIYNEYHSANGYRPDPDNAPHVCLGCLKRNDLVAKRIALGDVSDGSEVAQARLAAAAECKRKIEASNNEAHTVWQRWLRDQDKHQLWNSITFWQAALRVGHWHVSEALEKAPDVQTACDELLKKIYMGTREYNNGLGGQVHTVAAVQKVIKALGSVSRETKYDGIQEVFEGDGDEQDED